MKIYFSSSMRAKKIYKDAFQKIYCIVKDLGYKHTSDFLLKANADEFYHRTPGEEKAFYHKMVSQIKSADVCVFEVSRHSLGIGYSVNLALDFGKPVLLLHEAGRRPYLFSAIKSDRLQMLEYNQADLKEVLADALEEAKNNIDIRFTFFVTPKIAGGRLYR